jgi:hypothetical protein
MVGTALRRSCGDAERAARYPIYEKKRKKKAAAVGAAASPRHANEMLWFFSGTERMRLPVAAK